MIHGRGYATGYELAGTLGIAGISHEMLRTFAKATRQFMLDSGFAPIEPEFVENFMEGWYMRTILRIEKQATV